MPLPLVDEAGDDYLSQPKFTIKCGDAQQHLSKMPANFVDTIICDPPSGKEIMGIKWDTDKGGRDKWIEWLQGIMKEALRVLRPGGWAVVWALPQTSHWTATALENAGFEIRDVVHHIFGNGLPKVKGVKASDELRTAIAAAGKSLDGLGTQLKPSDEHWIICRKPIGLRNVAECFLQHGTGAFNLDESRIPGGDEESGGRWPANVLLTHSPECEIVAESVPIEGTPGVVTDWKCADDCPVALMDKQSGITINAAKAKKGMSSRTGGYKGGWKNNTIVTYSDIGGASRYFAQFVWEPDFDELTFQYVNKPSRKERHAGTEDVWEMVDEVTWGSEVTDPKRYEIEKILQKSEVFPYRFDPIPGAKLGEANARIIYRFEHIPVELLVFFDGLDENGQIVPLRNVHPTVKPVNLLRYFVRMFVPPGGTCLDMFAGSGTTGVACYLEGRDSVLIELMELNCNIIGSRMAWATQAYKTQGDTVVVRKKIRKKHQPGTMALDLMFEEEVKEKRSVITIERLPEDEVVLVDEVIGTVERTSDTNTIRETSLVGVLHTMEPVTALGEEAEEVAKVPDCKGQVGDDDPEGLFTESLFTDESEGMVAEDAFGHTAQKVTIVKVDTVKETVKVAEVKKDKLDFAGSSNVVSAWFVRNEYPEGQRVDIPKGTLFVTFKGNRTYKYIDVPEVRWGDVKILHGNGGSFGTWLNDNIKLKYEFEPA